MMRMRFEYAVNIELSYLSHLDLMRLMLRALRRAELPVAFTQGYNPHPKFNFAAPLPVGITAEAEYGDIYLTDNVSAAYMLKTLGAQLPAGLTLSAAAEVPLEEPSLAAVINAALYHARWAGPSSAPGENELKEALDNLMARDEIIIERRNKKGAVMDVDIKPYIHQASLFKEGEETKVALLLQLGSKGGASPFSVLNELNDLNYQEEHQWRLHRRALYINDQGGLKAPLKERR